MVLMKELVLSSTKKTLDFLYHQQLSFRWTIGKSRVHMYLYTYLGGGPPESRLGNESLYLSSGGYESPLIAGDLSRSNLHNKQSNNGKVL